MYLQEIKRSKKKVLVSVRIPVETRDRARAMAESQSGDDIQVTESDVYRHIIVDYFSHERLQNQNSDGVNTGANQS